MFLSGGLAKPPRNVAKVRHFRELALPLYSPPGT